MRLKSLLFLSLISLSFAGCGGSDPSTTGSGSSGVSKLVQSQSCMATSCHGTMTTPGTGALIVDEWLASTHNTKNGAGCADCHEPDAGHPNLCNKCHGGGGYGVVANPDTSGKCGKCHGTSFPNDVLMALAPQHFGYSSARVLPQTPRASYVSGQYQGRCRACHNPHLNNLTQQHRDWATSQHGDPKGVAWSSRDFKHSASCIRCHTSTGFIAYVTSGFTAPSTGFGSSTDTSRELLACDACHTSYGFKTNVRKIGAFTAPYTAGGSTVNFPDTGNSNLCIPCHSGRSSADNIAAVKDFSNASFVNSHYLAVAGLMYMKIGFKDFTTASAPANAATPSAAQYSYGDSYTMFTGPAVPAAPAGQVNSAHRRFGTPLINGDTHVAPSKGLLASWAPGTMDTGGPCVTCHLNATDSNGALATNDRLTSHTLAINTNTFNQVCVNCHYTDVPQASVSAATVREFLDENGGDYQNALILAAKVLQSRYQISYNSAASPYFYDLALDPTGKTPVKDWTRGTMNQAFGRRMMGACFNLNLLYKEPAAYVHARTYARRLIYDTIDFLDDGLINMSVGATAVATDNVTFVKGSTTATSSRAFNYLCNLTQPERK
jgi:predicted nucleic-acid-binding Zn-ribbon protein